MELLQRNPATVADSEHQARGFRVWAFRRERNFGRKPAGPAKRATDCAYLELPNGQRVVLVIFTVVMPKSAKSFLRWLGRLLPVCLIVDQST